MQFSFKKVEEHQNEEIFRPYKTIQNFITYHHKKHKNLYELHKTLSYISQLAIFSTLCA